jgi:hypothetical protein
MPGTAKQREKIVAALKANPNAAAVAREVGGVSRITVWQIAKDEGIRLRPGVAPISQRLRIRVVGALKLNPHGPQVARQTGVTPNQVWHIGRAAGIRFGPPGRRISPASAHKTSPPSRPTRNSTRSHEPPV